MKSVPIRIVLVACVAALALVASGCGTTTPTSPNLTHDSADDIAMQTATTLGIVNLDVLGGAGGAGALLVSRPGASRSAAEWDTSFAVGGLSFEASRQFYNADGGLMPGYGPDAVRMVWTSRVYGTAELPRDTLTIGHSASTEFGGIQPLADTLRINGAALDTLMNRFRSYDGTRTRYFYWNSALDVADVLLLKSTLDASPWPLSGTMTLVVEADRLRSNDRADVEAHLSATVVVTFNGTSQPDIVVDGTWHYRWNMVTGAVTRV